MQDVRQMTPDELRAAVRTMATGFAAEHHRRQFPRATDAEAWAWAERNWQQFEARAIDALAMIGAGQAAAEAAPEN